MKRWLRVAAYSPHTIRLMAWWAVVAVALAVFAKLTSELRESDAELQSIDDAVTLWLATFRTGPLNGIAVDVTALGSAALATTFAVVGLIVLLLAGDRIAAMHLAISSIGAGLLTSAFKSWLARPRPELVPRLVEVSGYSYPSGHSLTSATIFFTLAVLAARHLRGLHARATLFLLATALAGAVGLSRVYLGVHFASDALSGACLGTAWSLFLGSIFSVLYWRRTNA